MKEPIKPNIDTVMAVLAWASENVVDLWVASQWAGYLRGREQKGPAHFVGPTLYEALRVAWEKRDE